MVECAGLEIRYTVSPYRGFESLLLRHKLKRHAGFSPMALFYSLSYPLFALD